MVDFCGEHSVWLNRKIWVQSLNRFRDQGVMSPKNTVPSVGTDLCAMASIRTVVRDGSAPAASTRSTGEILLLDAHGRWSGFVGG